MASPALQYHNMALPVAACARVVAYLAPLERACVRRACGLGDIPTETLAHVADFHHLVSDGDSDDASATSLLLAMAMASSSGTVTRANAAHGSGHLGVDCHPRNCADRADSALSAQVRPSAADGLTCALYVAWGPNGKPSHSRWTDLLLLHTAVGFGPPPLSSAAPLDRQSHFPSCVTEMSARQIVPQAETQPTATSSTMRSKQPQVATKPPRCDVVSSSSSSSSSLAMLFQRLALARRRRAQQKQQQTETNQHTQRASWPCVRADLRGHKEVSFARRAQQSLVNALAALQRDASAGSSSSSSLLTPPQFLLRTQRRLSQRFNHKIVMAVGKDVRRSESQRRSSLTLLEAPSRSTSSLCSDASDETDQDEYPLKMSERLSLSLGRRISRDFAPMLTEGSALECRVRELVYGLLRDPAALEGHVCARFFAKQEAFTSPLPAACRYYLARVRDTISDLVQFIVEYRMRELGDEFLPFFEPDNNQDEDLSHDSSVAFAHELEGAVRRAVEEYFVFSLRYEIRQWCAGASSHAERATFRKTLARWRDLPSTSSAFGLKNRDPMLATQPLVASAIEKLQELEAVATPTRKMESLLAACHALGAFITQSRASFSGDLSPLPPLSPSARVCLGDADSFLPLLIFAVSRCKVRDAFALGAGLHGLFPFASQHGERMYYLTMFEAALEFIRSAPLNA